MECYLMSMKDACVAMGYDPETERAKAHDWLLSKGVKQFRKGFYAKDVILEFVRKESEKCILGNGASTTTSRAKSVWATKPMKLKTTARA